MGQLKVSFWAQMTFTKNLMEAFASMDSIKPKELDVWYDAKTDVVVSTPCRTFEIRYRPYGDEGKVHSVEVHYANYKENHGDTFVHNINNMQTVVDQINKYFGLLEE